MKINICVLFLIFGEDYLKKGLVEIDKILDRMFDKNIKKKYVIIDNACKIDETERNQFYYINGDNNCFDFSGWDKGYKYSIKKELVDDNTLFFFVNDTFFRRNYADGGNFLEEWTSDIIRGKDIKNSAIGFLDDFPKNVSINGIVYNSWIRSNIFFIPQKIMYKLEKLVFDFSENRIFSETEEAFWSDDSLISENWKAYINSWMFGIEDESYPEYKLHWIKAEKLTSKNKAFFKKKARTILSEHYLTARLFDMNIDIINTNVFPKNPLRHIKPYYKEQE